MDACPLEAAALLLIDMQNHFEPCAAPLVPRLNALAAAARAAGLPVVWTQHGHPDPPRDAATSNLVRWWGPENSIKHGSHGALTGGVGWTGRLSVVLYPGPEDSPHNNHTQTTTTTTTTMTAWQLLPGLRIDRARDAVIDQKRTYDAFHLTPLQGALEARGVRALVIGGVMTELCCETTARVAFCRGYDVFFLADGTGTDAASHHQAAIRALKFGFATVVEVDEAVGAMEAFAAAAEKQGM